jgi:serine/threonine-protein kinase
MTTRGDVQPTEDTPAEREPEATTGEVRMVGDKYQILRVRGRGGMGVVYEAENTWTRRRVALKVLAPGKETSPSRVQRFMAEARTASQINHPNIVGVLDMGQAPSDGALYIVQEWLDGEDLRERLRREGKLDPAAALAVILPVLRALSVAHERGIIHRDIKPANIFLARTTDGEVVPKIIDFGISKELGVQTSLIETETGQILGTPAYMSPEQLKNERPIGPSTDVWAVGVVLYEMLAGAGPFAADNYNVLVHRVLAGERVPLSTAAPSLDPELVAIVHRALEVSPADRCTSARELHDALAAWRGDPSRVSGERPVKPEPPANESVATPVAFAETLAETPRPLRRSWRLIALVASVTAAFALTAAVALRVRATTHTTMPRPVAAITHPEPAPPSPAPPRVEPSAPTPPSVTALTETAPAQRAHTANRAAPTAHARRTPTNHTTPHDGVSPAPEPAVPSTQIRVRPHTQLLTPGGSYPSQ